MSQSLRRDLPLDGLRAVSVMFVILSHVMSLHGQGWIGKLGGVGVGVFFVISGYIITRVFAHDLAREGGRPIAAFYIKRAFRILPVLIAYLMVINLLYLAGLAAPDFSGTFCSLIFLRNFSFCPGLPITTHFWSLSVEEQFYLWWPWVFILLNYLGHLRLGVVCFFIASMMLTVWSAYHGVWLLPGITRNLPFITAGITLALFEPGIRTFLDRQRLIAVLASPVLILLALSWLEVPYITDFGLYEAGCFVVAPLTFALMVAVRSHGWLSQALSLAPVSYIGRVSFSLYVWQQLFLVSGEQVPLLKELDPWLLIAMTFSVAILSHHVIEAISLVLRNRVLDRLNKLPSKALV